MLRHPQGLATTLSDCFYSGDVILGAAITNPTIVMPGTFAALG